MRIKFSATGAAFSDGNFRAECVRILREIADKMDGGRESGFCHDINGNRIGEWSAGYDGDDETEGETL